MPNEEGRILLSARPNLYHIEVNYPLQAQQHSFNCPYQLASPTKWPEADKPEDADVYEIELLPGDIVILGSDGLFDNMWNYELEAIVAEHIVVSQGCMFSVPSQITEHHASHLN